MMDFLQDIGLFDPTKAETGTPLYENMVLMVQRSNLSAKILTVGLVQNLAKLVVVANINKWQQIVPSDRLKKIEFVHLLGFICDRNMKIEDVAQNLIRNVWGQAQKSSAAASQELWPGLKYFGIDPKNLNHDKNEAEGSGKKIQLLSIVYLELLPC